MKRKERRKWGLKWLKEEGAQEEEGRREGKGEWLGRWEEEGCWVRRAMGKEEGNVE